MTALVEFKCQGHACSCLSSVTEKMRLLALPSSSVCLSKSSRLHLQRSHPDVDFRDRAGDEGMEGDSDGPASSSFWSPRDAV